MNGECVSKACPEDQPFLETDGSCRKTCVSKIFKEIQTKTNNKAQYVCISECDYYIVKLSFQDYEISKCVPTLQCASPTPLLVAESLQCVAKCPRTKFLLLEARVCVDQCPYFHYYEDSTFGAVCI